MTYILGYLLIGVVVILCDIDFIIIRYQEAQYQEFIKTGESPGPILSYSLLVIGLALLWPIYLYGRSAK